MIINHFLFSFFHPFPNPPVYPVMESAQPSCGACTYAAAMRATLGHGVEGSGILDVQTGELLAAMGTLELGYSA